MNKGLIALLLLSMGCITVTDDKGKGTGDTGDTTDTTDTDTTDTDTTIPDPDDDGDGFPLSLDCDDNNAAINPGALEACDGIDNNCDLNTDDAAAATLDGANYATLDDLWAAVTDGSSASVCAGTWTITTATLDVGTVTLTSVDGRDSTTITEATAEPAFAAFGDGVIVLDGFTISGSGAQALDVIEGGTISVLNSHLTGNGQGVALFGGTNNKTASVTIDATNIDGNINGNGDGGGIGGELAVSVTVTNSNITGNSGINGGGVWVHGTFVAPSVTISDSDISGNSADIGGGINITGTAAPPAVSITNTTINGNTATTEGGGVYLRNEALSASVTLSSVTVDGNGAVNGAGISATNVDLLGTGIEITNNIATGNGGGLFIVEASVSGALVSTNAAVSGGGAAVNFDADFNGNQFNPDFIGVIFDTNSADLGGGLFVDNQSTATLDATSQVTLNTATTGGGGSWLDGNTAHVVSNGANWGSAAAGNDNTPDDVSSAAVGFSVLYDDALSSFDCVGSGTCTDL